MRRNEVDKGDEGKKRHHDAQYGLWSEAFGNRPDKETLGDDDPQPDKAEEIADLGVREVELGDKEDLEKLSEEVETEREQDTDDEKPAQVDELESLRDIGKPAKEREGRRCCCRGMLECFGEVAR